MLSTLQTLVSRLSVAVFLAEILDGAPVALEAQSDKGLLAGHARIGDLPEGLPAVHIGDVDLHRRNRHGLQRVQNGGRVAVFVARVKGQVDRLLGGVAHIVGVPLAERIRGYVTDGRLPLGLERQTPVADRRGNRGLGFSVCLRGGRIGLWQQEEQHGKRNAYAGRRADAAKRVAGNGNEHK